MTNREIEADLELAVAATRAAGREVLTFFGKPHEVTFKGPDQPLTQADLVADSLLKQSLLGERPEYGWLSEETQDSPERLARDRVWLVDPIDGTRSFIDGWPEYVVSVALAVQRKVVLGVVSNPSTDELFHAVFRQGAYRNGARIHLRDEGKSLLASRSDLRNGEFEPLRDEWELTPLGSTAYKMVKVADGTGSAYVSRGPKSEWDVAAASLIVEEAGGVVTDAAGDPFRFNQPAPFLRGVVVAAREAHEGLVRRIASLPQPREQSRREAP